jgi:NAD(P)-dependent dehydrogenase (short-subunit alcohol dehydrogenase family)
MRFTDRVVIVTGASREGQIGEALAQAFAREGAQLVLAARTEANVKKLAGKLGAEGARALPVAADLMQEAGAKAVADAALKTYGRIDVLVNLAGGLTKFGPAVELSLADFQQELNNNLLTAFLCARAVIPTMQQANRGRIITFTSATAASPMAQMVAYNCAKAAVIALTRTLALELKKTDVTVNAIAPGLVDTEANVKAMKPSPEDLQKKWVSRDAVARATLFLASDDAAGITGQVLTVAGRGIS